MKLLLLLLLSSLRHLYRLMKNLGVSSRRAFPVVEEAIQVRKVKCVGIGSLTIIHSLSCRLNLWGQAVFWGTGVCG